MTASNHQPDQSDDPQGDHNRPRDAATLVLVDNRDSQTRLLMGKRRAGQVFMPNKVVFPGGRVDEEDKAVASADELADIEIAKLMMEMKGHPSHVRSRALAMAAIREVYEETGIIVGAQTQSTGNVPDQWQRFFAKGYAPKLSGLCFFARAITPPGRSRRYDTRFFCASASEIALQTDELDDELSEINWYTVAETADLDLPPITRVIIEELGDRLAAAPLGPMSDPIPFYHQRHGNFRREMLNPQSE